MRRTARNLGYGLIQLNPPGWFHVQRRYYMAGRHYTRIFVGKVAITIGVRWREPLE